MDTNDGFVPILAIFYAVFHPTEGTKIIHQVPENSIIQKGSAISDNSLFDFDTVKNYIIPKPQLCNRLLSFKIDRHRVIGYPVNIESTDYLRNSFNFNFGFVFPYDRDTTPYEPAIQRMGKMFRVLEEQSFILSKLEAKLLFYPRDDNNKPVIPLLIYTEFNKRFPEALLTPGQTKYRNVELSSIESLIHQIYQDLNNYLECCIPLDTANSVDIKLFPILPPPMNIKAYQVPVSTVKLSSMVDVNWDPTMLKILPHINGVNSIKKISELADADYLLTKQCVQHLMPYKCITMIDIFQFGNIYAPTNHIGDFLKTPGLAQECQAYIVTGEPISTTAPTSTTNTPHNMSASVSPYTRTNYLQLSKRKETKTIKVPSKTSLFFLYRSLNQGQTLKEWYIQYRKLLGDIDIRRFITFGMLRGLIYRVHSYPVIGSFNHQLNVNDELDELMEEFEAQQLDKPPHLLQAPRVSFSADRRQITFSDSDSDIDDASAISIHDQAIDDTDPDETDAGDMIKLVKLLKGYQCMDSICTELHRLRGEVEAMLHKLGNFSIING